MGFPWDSHGIPIPIGNPIPMAISSLESVGEYEFIPLQTVVYIILFKKAAKGMISYMPLTCCAINEPITRSIANIVGHKSRKLETKNHNNRIRL